jgi:uncharacterized membrane protein HdeD (DUF308 family)
MDMPAGSAGEMDVPADAPGRASTVDVESAETRQAVATVARFWWAWLVAGILWIVASMIILQLDHRSVRVVGVALGITFIVAGIEEFAAAYMTESGWRWLWVAFGVLLLGGGIWALFNPTNTFLAVASILGFVFVLIGIGWMVQALATLGSSPLAWISIIAAILMIGLGFWAASQALVTQVYVLLIFAGVWALLHGVTDIVKAFMIRQAGKLAYV